MKDDNINLEEVIAGAKAALEQDIEGGDADDAPETVAQDDEPVAAADDASEPEGEGDEGDADHGDDAGGGEGEDAKVPEGEPEGAAQADPLELLGQQLGMSPAEVQEVLEALSAARKDPKVAAEKLEEKARRIKEAAGIELPQDLREKVEAGLLEEEDAREIAEARQLKAKLQEFEQRSVLDRAAAAVTSWEAKKRAEDKAFDRFAEPLYEFTRDVIGPAVMRGAITPEEATRLLDAEYARLSRVAQTARPKKRRPVVASEGDTRGVQKKSERDMLIEKVAAILSGEGS